jgi:hypothetical protein
VVRLRRDACKRVGACRLARLAVKLGSEILLDDWLLRLSADCPWRDDPRGTCGVRLSICRRACRPICRRPCCGFASCKAARDEPCLLRPAAPHDRARSALEAGRRHKHAH